MTPETRAERQQNVILNLVSVDTCDLEPEDRECPICKEDLQLTFLFNDSEETEPPVKIAACGHVYGVRCIYRWLMAHGTCPLCRGDLEILARPIHRVQPDTISADEASRHIPDWIERSFTGRPIHNLGGNTSGWGSSFEPVRRTPSPPAPMRTDTQPVDRASAWLRNVYLSRTPIPGRPIRRPALRRPAHTPALPLTNQSPARIESSISRDGIVTFEGDPSPRWTLDSIRRVGTDASEGEASDQALAWGDSFRPAIQMPEILEPWVAPMRTVLRPIGQGRAGRRGYRRGRPTRTPAWTESPISRDSMTQSVREASSQLDSDRRDRPDNSAVETHDQTPRSTPESIGRDRTNNSEGEASSAMVQLAQLSIQDDDGQKDDVEASATTNDRALST